MAESRLADRPPEFWKAVEADYVGGRLRLKEIHQKHDLTPGEFNYAKTELKWKRRKQTPVSRKAILKRLFRLVDRMTLQRQPGGRAVSARHRRRGPSRCSTRCICRLRPTTYRGHGWRWAPLRGPGRAMSR